MLEQCALHVRDRLLKETNFEQLSALPQQDLRQSIGQLIATYIQEEKWILSRQDQARLINRVLDDSVGFGPLENFLQDEQITEIMVNGPAEIYIERDGKLEKTDIQFRDNAHLRHIIDRMVAPVGRRIDESSPMVDARLHDGSRLHAVLPPVSLQGPVLTIRKFRKEPYQMQDLVDNGTLTPEMAIYLEGAVRAKLNILISGGTGSGKTTLLNVLSSFIPVSERIITIEDSAELQLQGQHVIGLETRLANVEGTGDISIRDLIRNSLRMRPDRIIVGEVRGSEAFDMLQAMNTGHKGSLTTIHANSPFDALSRLEAMVLFGKFSMPIEVIEKYILRSLDLIVQTERMIDGTRRVVSIAEVRKDQQTEVVREIFCWGKTESVQVK